MNLWYKSNFFGCIIGICKNNTSEGLFMYNEDEMKEVSEKNQLSAFWIHNRLGVPS